MRINNYAFRRLAKYQQESYDVENQSTINGVIKKSILLIGITFLTAIISIILVAAFPLTYAVYIPVLIIDFIFMLIIMFSPKAAKTLSIPYAVMEGIMAGCIAGILELALPGYGLATAGLAFIITCAIVLIASVLYLSGTIKVTTRFRKIMFTVLLSLFIGSILMVIFALLFPAVFAVIAANWGLSIIIEIIFVLVASIYIVISLDNAVQIVEAGLHKDFEWYAAYGILINVIWLYYEVLRLLLTILSRTRSNN